MTGHRVGGNAAPGAHGGSYRVLRALAVAHPAPSAINAALVASLAIVAGAGATTAGLLAAAMFGFQVSIGALNDIVDAGEDRRATRDKPIPEGLVSMRAATAIAIVGGLVGLTISGGFGLWALILGATGYGAGVAYDLFMRRLGLGWLCFAVAFPALLAWTWTAAAGTLPPGWPFLLPLAALAGPMIHLANSLVDLESDEQAGVTTLATRLGPTQARWALAGLTVSVYLFAWVALMSLAAVDAGAILAAVFATVMAAVGVGLSWQGSSRALQAGWMAQACGLAIFAVAWIVSVM